MQQSFKSLHILTLIFPHCKYKGPRVVRRTVTLVPCLPHTLFCFDGFTLSLHVPSIHCLPLRVVLPLEEVYHMKQWETMCNYGKQVQNHIVTGEWLLYDIHFLCSGCFSEIIHDNHRYPWIWSAGELIFYSSSVWYNSQSGHFCRCLVLCWICPSVADHSIDA
jgi:hypothetical protein